MLEFDQVVKHYRSGEEVVRAVDGVSFAVHPGELVALYGPSGSGKSTLLRLAAAVARPDDGTVSFDRRDLASLSARETTRYQRAQIGFVMQGFGLVAGMPAIDNAGLKLLADGVSRREARLRAWPWLERVGLARRSQQPPERLSGGERQRVAIARALANEPRLLLADEPTANLDSQRADEILRLLGSIAHERSVAVLLVTHDPLAAAHAARVETLRDGQLHPGAPATSPQPNHAGAAPAPGP